MELRGREQHRWANREVEVSGSTRVKAWEANEFQTKRAERESSVIDPNTAAKTARGLIKDNAALFKRLS